jgi:PBP1b-binding outer membrane lipoprotein LpoB
VEFVAAGDQRGEVREERKDQDINAREDTRKAMGQEVGADFMMKGSINMIVDQSGDTNVRYYQVDLNLISLADNRIVWVGQKKIKKVVEKAKLRF